MSHTGIWVLVVLLGVWTCAGEDGPEECPDKFWEGPTRKCLHIIDSVLDELVRGEWQVADIRINKTCKAYDSMKMCMEDLLAKCAKDESKVNDLRKVIERYEPYSLPCHDETLRHRQRVIDCFHKHISNTRKCVNNFDQNYKSHIIDEDFDAICSDIETVMQCFHSTKLQIQNECGDEGAAVYQMNYISPVVAPTTNLVLDHCSSMAEPYRQYYGMEASSTGLINGNIVIVFGAVLLKLLS